MTSRGVLLILIFFSMLSCKKEFENEAEPLLGEWRHIYSVVHDDGDYNPPSAPFTDSLYPSDLGHQYGIDVMKKGQVLLKKDGELELVYKILNVSMVASSNSSWSRFDLELGHQINKERFSLNSSKDTLLVGSFYPASENGVNSYALNYFIKVD